MMNFILEGVGIHLKGRLHKIGGWIAHYIIGFALVLTYESLWRYTSIRFGFVSGIIFGIVTGVIGIICWRAIYRTSIHVDVARRSYYIQLFFGHIIFALAVVIAFRIFKYDPISKITPYIGLN
jgi:Ca2+/Na+ antiporter